AARRAGGWRGRRPGVAWAASAAAATAAPAAPPAPEAARAKGSSIPRGRSCFQLCDLAVKGKHTRLRRAVGAALGDGPAEAADQRRQRLAMQLVALDIGVMDGFDPAEEQLPFRLQTLEADTAEEGQGLLCRIGHQQHMALDPALGMGAQRRL